MYPEAQLLPQVNILVDTEKFCQAIGNVIANAVKVSPVEGKVTVGICVMCDGEPLESVEQVKDGASYKLRIEVHDAGPGLSNVSFILINMCE